MTDRRNFLWTPLDRDTTNQRNKASNTGRETSRLVSPKDVLNEMQRRYTPVYG